MKDKTSKVLAAIVVAYRSLGFMKDEAREAMQELMRRREEEKEDFDFEQFIEEEVAKIPKPTTDVAKYLNTLQSLNLSDQVTEAVNEIRKSV